MKIFMCLLLTASSALAFSQGLSVNTSSYDLELGEYVDYGVLVVSNDGDAATQIAVTLTKLCITDGDNPGVQICAGELCFMPTYETTTWGDNMQEDPVVTIAAGGSFDQFKISQLVAGDYGSQWSLTIFDRNSVENSTTVMVNIDECAAVLSVDNEEMSELEAYPNPVSDVLNIPVNTQDQGLTMVVSNAFGQELRRIRIASAQTVVQLYVEELEAGTYFYYTEGNDAVVKRFIKTDR